jgi:flavin reductase (DIM6/NTAB) family NADH-FMN oxidoreductase RutF
MPIDNQLFRAAMGRLVTGVTVLAARDPDGTLIGMTASAVTSLSLDPPMLLVCVGHAAAAHPALTRGDRFSVNVLGTEQQELSRRFATRDLQRFEGIACDVTPSGLPWLRGALACLECRRDAVHEGGDHSIVTGVIEWAKVGGGDPLLYYLGGYRRIGAA